MRLLLFVTFLSFSLLPIYASNGDVSECFNITNNSHRLDCYDRILDRKQQTSTNEQSGEWLTRQTVSPLDDTIKVSALLASQNYVSDLIGRKRKIVMIISCENLRSVFYFSFDWQIPNSQVNYRIDKQKAQKVIMEASNDSKSIGLWRDHMSINFVEELLDHEKLFIQVIPKGQNIIQAEFNITGMRQSISPVISACKWNF